MSNYFTKTEGAIWDILSSLDEMGEGGTYRGQEYLYREMPKAHLAEATGIDFRLGRFRAVLEQLVAIGVVDCRLPDGRVGFYSIPEGMTKDEFFRRKGQARFAWKATAELANKPLAAELLHHLDVLSIDEAYTELAQLVTTKFDASEVPAWWARYRRQSGRFAKDAHLTRHSGGVARPAF